MKNNIVFVGGAPRSGTTLVQRLLDSHPDVVGGPELNAISDIVALFTQMRMRIEEERTDFYCNTEQLNVLFRKFILSLFEEVRTQHKAIWISEKTPSNVLVFKELLKIIPGAKFIYIERDPKDVLASYYTVKRIALEKGKKSPALYRIFFLSLDDVYEHMEAGHSFCEKHQNVSYVLRYEDLVNNPATEMQHLLEFLGLPYSQDVLSMNGPGQYFKEKRVKKVNSVYYTQADIAKPIDKNSIGKWRGVLSMRKAGFVDHVFKGTSYVDYQSGLDSGYTLVSLYRLHRRLLGSNGLPSGVYRKLLQM
jgi:hypothetical protein